MMPAPVAEELKTGRDVIPQYYDSATLCYIDIVNFVSLISDMQPIHVTKLLNAFYKYYIIQYLKQYSCIEIDEPHVNRKKSGE